MTKDKKTIVSMRSRRKPADMQSDKQSMNSYMKRNQGVLMKIRGALQGQTVESADDDGGMDFGGSSSGKGNSS